MVRVVLDEHVGCQLPGDIGFGARDVLVAGGYDEVGELGTVLHLLQKLCIAKLRMDWGKLNNVPTAYS
jgi:hypothetical protein